jgi:hypothetical protein
MLLLLTLLLALQDLHAKTEINHASKVLCSKQLYAAAVITSMLVLPWLQQKPAGLQVEAKAQQTRVSALVVAWCLHVAVLQ